MELCCIFQVKAPFGVEFGFTHDWGICYDVADKREFIKENIDEIIFMFALFKCRKSDKGRN